MRISEARLRKIIREYIEKFEVSGEDLTKPNVWDNRRKTYGAPSNRRSAGEAILNQLRTSTYDWQMQDPGPLSEDFEAAYGKDSLAFYVKALPPYENGVSVSGKFQVSLYLNADGKTHVLDSKSGLSAEHVMMYAKNIDKLIPKLSSSISQSSTSWEPGDAE